MTDEVFRLSAAEAFEEPEMGYDEFDSIVDSSLHPRSPDVLFDKLGVLVSGMTEARVLDVGCRDATHMCEAAERFDALVLGRRHHREQRWTCHREDRGRRPV